MTNFEKSKALLELAKAMEAGWKKAPRMERIGFYRGGTETNPLSCCARGHAGLGKYGDANQGTAVDFPILEEQAVWASDGDISDLRNAIDDLVLRYGWYTPQVARWIRSHI